MIVLRHPVLSCAALLACGLASAAANIAITETFTAQGDGLSRSREIKLSTKGLSTALEQLQKDCGGAKFLDAPGVKFLDMPRVGGGR